MDDKDAALGRLTDNEKDCLRRWLAHQTAKEMALDLGVSPHAVEKRLKMARLKLGVASSLAAARLLAAAEGYGATGPRPPDLAVASPAAQDSAARSLPPGRWARRAIPLAGVLTMILAITLALLAQSVPQAAPSVSPQVSDEHEAIVELPADSPGPHVAGEPATERAEDVAMRAAGPEEVAAFARSSFGTMDKDGSGYIEQAEAPHAGVGIPAPGGADRRGGGSVQWFTGRRGQAMWIANMDTDRDGRASADEYVAWDVKIWRDHVPANWAWRR